MSKNRYLPFGYQVCRGLIIPHESEAEEVRRVYRSYLNGQSFGDIAADLTSRRVQFLPGRSDWDKSRVKRLLENSRYKGDNQYPTILDTGITQQVQATIAEKRSSITTSSEDIKSTKGLLVCSICGQPMHRCRTHGIDRWRCKNGCGVSGMTQDKLLAYSSKLLHRLIENPHILEQPQIQASVKVEHWQEGLIPDDVDYSTDSEMLRDRLLQACSQAYKDLPSSKPIHYYEQMLEGLKTLPMQDGYEMQTIRKFISNMTVNRDRTITVTLLNNQIMKL